MSYFVRISRPYADLQPYYDDIPCDKLAVYEHEADEDVSRTHVHYVVFGSKIKPDAMKTRIKKIIGDIDKGDWSFQSVQKDGKALDNGSITYMSKGHLPPKLCKGYTIEEIQELTALWVEPTPIVKKTTVVLENGKLVRKINETDKKTKRQMLESMSALLPDGDVSTRKAKLEAIRTVLIQNNQVLGPWKVDDYYHSLHLYKYKDSWLDMMEVMLEKRYGGM